MLKYEFKYLTLLIFYTSKVLSFKINIDKNIFNYWLIIYKLRKKYLNANFIENDAFYEKNVNRTA